MRNQGTQFDKTTAYTYDDRGNISSVTANGSTTTYVYDNLGQLTRENNQAAGKTWTWTYDTAGNILSKSENAYTTGSLGTALDTITYLFFCKDVPTGSKHCTGIKRDMCSCINV